MAHGAAEPQFGSQEAWALRTLQVATAHAETVLGKRLQLSQREAAALSHMASAMTDMTPSRLAERLDLSASATTELVDRLERNGHLSRERDHADRRRVRLRASELAVSRVRAEVAPLMADLDRVAKSFSAEERAAIVRFLHEAAAVHDLYASDSLET